MFGGADQDAVGSDLVAARHGRLGGTRRGWCRLGGGRRGSNAWLVTPRVPPAFCDSVDVDGEDCTNDKHDVGGAHPPIERLNVQPGPHPSLHALGPVGSRVGSIVGPPLTQRVLARHGLAPELLLVLLSHGPLGQRWNHHVLSPSTMR